MPETFNIIGDIGATKSKELSDKTFSKEKWLEAAKKQLKQGYITEDELSDACDTWVNALDGKKYSEIDELERTVLNENWFV